jgi:hypothetical protein
MKIVKVTDKQLQLIWQINNREKAKKIVFDSEG